MTITMDAWVWESLALALLLAFFFGVYFGRKIERAARDWKDAERILLSKSWQREGW